MKLMLQTMAELAARATELRPLTDPENRRSDMNLFLDALGTREPPELIAGVVALADDGRVLGWAICERFVLRREYTLLSVFVAPNHRRQGIGTALGRQVLEEAQRVQGGPQLYEADDFWRPLIAEAS